MSLFTNEKHYNTLNNYYLAKYHSKVFKVALNGNFSCPNLDGIVAYGGCTFCSPLGSGDFAGRKKHSLEQQFLEVKNMMHLKWHQAKYISYFQANTNTHGPVSKLKELFEEAICLDDKIVMISIATRPDCLPLETLSYLANLNKRMPVQIELGLQTIHEETSLLINRSYDTATFDQAVSELRKREIEVVVHIINGLPFETNNMMLETINHLNKLDIQGIKIHMLHIMKQTKMGRDFLKTPWPVLTLEEYVEITVQQIRQLNPKIIIHRLTGDAPINRLIAPLWTKKKFVTINEIDKKLRNNNWFQGDFHEL